MAPADNGWQAGTRCGEATPPDAAKAVQDVAFTPDPQPFAFGDSQWAAQWCVRKHRALGCFNPALCAAHVVRKPRTKVEGAE